MVRFPWDEVPAKIPAAFGCKGDARQVGSVRRWVTASFRVTKPSVTHAEAEPSAAIYASLLFLLLRELGVNSGSVTCARTFLAGWGC